ncbi:MAG: hypothetical protein U0234_09060 [Sandaracinus sp.]
MGLRFEPRESESARYVHRDSGVGFVMPAAADEGLREEDDAGFERVVVHAIDDGVEYRVVIFRPIDGTEVDPASAIARLADGLVAGQTALRDQTTSVDDHPARRLALTQATSGGGEVAFLVTADTRALVMMELVAPAGRGTAALADPFFASLELGCDR